MYETCVDLVGLSCYSLFITTDVVPVEETRGRPSHVAQALGAVRTILGFEQELLPIVPLSLTKQTPLVSLHIIVFGPQNTTGFYIFRFHTAGVRRWEPPSRGKLSSPISAIIRRTALIWSTSIGYESYIAATCFLSLNSQ